jgi:hypothetical protein
MCYDAMRISSSRINHLAPILFGKAPSIKIKRALCSNNLIKVHVGASRLATGPRNANVNYKSRRYNDNEERSKERERVREGGGEREKEKRKKTKVRVGIVPNGSH